MKASVAKQEFVIGSWPDLHEARGDLLWVNLRPRGQSLQEPIFLPCEALLGARDSVLYRFPMELSY